MMKDDTQPFGKAFDKADAIAAVKCALDLEGRDKKEGCRPNHEETRSQKRRRPSDEDASSANKNETTGKIVTSVEKRVAMLLSTVV